MQNYTRSFHFQPKAQTLAIDGCSHVIVYRWGVFNHTMCVYNLRICIHRIIIQYRSVASVKTGTILNHHPVLCLSIYESNIMQYMCTWKYTYTLHMQVSPTKCASKHMCHYISTVYSLSGILLLTGTPLLYNSYYESAYNVDKLIQLHYDIIYVPWA